MDETLREPSSTTTWRAELARSLDEQRDSARALLAERRDRFKQLEAQLTGRIDALIGSLSDDSLSGTDRDEALARREQAIAQRDAELAERLKEFAQRENAWSLGLRESQARQQQWLDEVASRMAALEKRQEELNDLDCRLQVQQVALSRREAELDQQATELAERSKQLDHSAQQATQRQAAFDETRETLRLESEQLKRQFEELKQSQADLSRLRESLSERELETQRQRRHIAQQLRARKNELVAEIELHRAEALCSSHGEELQLQIRVSELQAKLDRAREELAERDSQQGSLAERVESLQKQLEQRDAELLSSVQRLESADAARQKLVEQLDGTSGDLSVANERLVSELATLRDQLTAGFESREQKLLAELAELRKRQEELLGDLESARTAADSARSDVTAGEEVAAELAQLREDNERLARELVEAKAQAGSGSPDQSEELDDLQNRLEMAVKDIRELKAKNTDLAEQLAKAKKASASAIAPAADTAGGWEAQKQRLLQQLENFDENDEEQKAERLKIEHAIRVTDQTVAEKEQEIQELRQLLQNQSENIGGVAVGAAAIAQMLDSDELIRQERENVKHLQGELEEKLRKAEVDISLERAKLARERAELEEKLQALERERTQLTAAYGEGGDQAAKGGGKQPARGRWLARLGLHGEEGKK